ncbi:PGF-pre-PGF domain-containing protein [Nanoarchaeota archaeon]
MKKLLFTIFTALFLVLLITNAFAFPFFTTSSSATNEFGSAFVFDVNATGFNETDLTGDVNISKYTLNDTTNFTINSTTGIMTNASTLALGSYVLNISVNDTSNNLNYTIFTITVSDTTVPLFTTLPTDQTINNTAAFGLNAGGTDLTTVGYSVNDTTNFAINTSGYVVNNTLLSVGEYNFNISINDTSGNVNSSVIKVVVNLIQSSEVLVDNATTIDLTSASANLTLVLANNTNSTVTAALRSINASGTTANLTVLKGINLTVDSTTSGNLTWALIKIYYTAAQLTTADINESSLLIYYYNNTASDWQLEGTQGIDEANNYVWANVTHFSLFGAFGTAPNTTVVADTSSSSSDTPSDGTPTPSYTYSKKFDSIDKNEEVSLVPTSTVLKETRVLRVRFTPNTNLKDIRVGVKNVNEADLEEKLDLVANYFEITKQNLFDSDLKETKVEFEVDKDWLEENDFEKEDVVLMKLDGDVWKEIETTYLSSTTDTFKFVGISDGFSFYGISARKEVADVAEGEGTEDEETTTGKKKGLSKWITVPLWTLGIIGLLVGMYFILLKQGIIGAWHTWKWPFKKFWKFK